MEQKRNNKNNIFDIDASMKTATKVMVTHIGASKGITLVGEISISAIFKESKQLGYGTMPGKKVMKAINPDLLSIKQKRMELSTINLVKEK